METAEQHIASAAAALVAEEGLDLESAKKRALRQLGLPPRTRLPSNERVEDAIQEYLRLFCADTQPRELRILRELALGWMQRLAQFQPLVGGAVWNGTATRHSDIHLQIFADDPKEPGIWLLNEGLEHEVAQAKGLHGAVVQVLGVQIPCPALQEYVTLHLWVNEVRALRGALLPDSRGNAPRGPVQALRQRADDALRDAASPILNGPNDLPAPGN